MSFTSNDSKIKQSIERFFETLEKLYPEHQVFALDAIDKHLRETLSKLSKLTGCTTPAVFLEKYGYKMISGEEVKKIRGTVKYLPGAEPDIIKGKVNSVVSRLRTYYPDGIIAKGIQREHKKLSNQLSGLYQWLGYENLAEMLKAYGFQYEVQAKGGRPTNDHEALIKTLQEKYSSEKKPRTVNEIIDDNPDLASSIKTLQNTSNKLFGMPLAKYFVKIGILQEADKSTFMCHEVLVDGQESSILCVSTRGLRPREGHRVQIRYSDGLAAIGRVIKSCVSVNENDLSTPKDEIPRIIRRILKKDYFIASVDGIDSPVFCAIDTQTVSKGDCVIMQTPNEFEEVTGIVIEPCYSVWEDKLPKPIEEIYRCVQILTKETTKEKAKGRAKKTYTVCKIRPQHYLNTLYYYSPFDEIKVGDIVKIPLRWSGFTSGEVISVEKTTDSLKCYDKIPIKKLQKIIEIDKADKTAIMDRTMILAQQLGTEEWSAQSIKNNTPEQYNAMTYFSSAIFRGLDNDVQTALLSIYSAYADPMKYKVEIVEGISQFECSNSLVPMVVEKFPNLKAIFFAEDWGDGSVYLAYSESGYDTVTSLRYIGECEFYARDRWTLIHDPSEEFFACGDVTYHFEEKESWEKCDYVLPCGNERLLGGTRVPSIPYHKEKSDSPCDIIQINFSGKDFAKREQRIKIIESKSLESFVDEILKNEWPISLPSGLKIHCSGSQNLNTTANTVKALLEKNIDELIEKVASSLEGSNYLDYSPSFFPYKIINNDIIFSLEIGSFEEFGKNVRLHDELFSIGDVIANTLSDLTSKYGKLPNATYEGIISWTQIWAEEYNSSVLLCNTERNEYAKELILNDDDFWNDYEFLMNF